MTKKTAEILELERTINQFIKYNEVTEKATCWNRTDGFFGINKFRG